MRALSFAARIVIVPFLCLGLATAPKAEIDSTCYANTDEPDQVHLLRIQAARLYEKRKYAEALRKVRALAIAVEKMETARDGAPGARTAYALAHLSRYALFARAPSEALKASERAHALVPCIVWQGEASRAHALLQLGRIGEARPIYLTYKQKRIFINGTWEDKIADDFDELRAAGVIHKSFPTILAELGIKHLELNSQIETARKKLDQLEKAQGSDHRAVVAALNNLGSLYQVQGRFSKAEDLFKRSLDIREAALGPDEPDVATSLTTLATVYVARRAHAGAEPLFQRSLAIRERGLGPDHPDVGASLDDLAGLYRKQARYAEATPLLQRSLAIREKAWGPNHANVATSLNDLAELYRQQGRYDEGELLFRRSLAIRERISGRDHPEVARSLNNLAQLYRDQGRYAEVEALLKRSLGIGQALGPENPLVGNSLSSLATLYRVQGRYAEAEPLMKRSLAISETAFGPDDPDVGRSLSNLAELYADQGRYAEAEPLFNRTLVIRERSMGSDHPEVAAVLDSLAALDQSRYLDKAKTLIERSLAIREKALGADHPDVGASLNNLAVLYRELGRYAEAEPLFNRSLAIRQRALGSDHSEVAASLNDMAILYQEQGRLAEAEPLYRRSLAIWDKALGADHPNVEISLYNLATLHLDQSDWAEAAEYWRRAIALIKRRGDRGLASTAVHSSPSEARQSVVGLVQVSHRLPVHSRASGAELFEIAQLAQASQAAASLAQLAARSTTASPQLAQLVRERQDLVGERQIKDKLLIAAKSERPTNRKPEAEKSFADRMIVIDARLAEIDQKLNRDFPDYAALSRPEPLSILEVQAQLRADEALVLLLDTDGFRTLTGESFVWVVTKSDLRWVQSNIAASALAREVTALRCGLDAAVWDGDGAQRCTGVLELPAFKEAPRPLPFDHVRAHKLYMSLFSGVLDLIKGKHLLIVPSGPLTQLPFHVLVTQLPTTSDNREVAWLARENAITVLPAVSSLKALRQLGRPTTAQRPLIGFGNPLLTGPSESYASRAKLARTKERCPEARQLVAERAEHRGGIKSVETRGGLANVSYIKMQVPLPETADELCTAAQYLKAEPSDIRLGARATEREIKRLSASGELAKYRIIHFATHGALAGELDGAHEPGLILTPPNTATEEDDGYLSASEIASLKLDAEWVVLSACNTAAGAANSAEALSGLGRAFIYAGARALLVSHWAVYSDATVKLITSAVDQMARDTGVGRAEAMRRSMLALIDKGAVEQAHPTYWAPFVVVGEGAVGR